ncbi:hypothetical protein [Streptomyces sp. SP18BB07]|uniref:hypothetical protein n=1 Tax=Streptomyces sp. SP18BB07 TaxID=3002522 RepID=UPI002E770577|nr:hypothetical protein [Streptomyces sp. SP18BB07]MEE1765169.1 hypothetical protein [Streptomyces sp. SP18BB07]
MSSKAFAGARSAVVVTAGAAVAYAARGESPGPGEVLSSGTLPGCCGLEMRRSQRVAACGRTVYATGL